MEGNAAKINITIYKMDILNDAPEKIVDKRNILDCYKGLDNNVIKQARQEQTFPFAILLQNVIYDINIGVSVRNANAFGAEKVFYYGMRKWNRVPAQGTYHYLELEYLETLDKVVKLKSQYKFVGLEITDQAVDLRDYQWEPNSLMIVGQEDTGLNGELLGMCDDVVQIPNFGTVRSLNLSVSLGIACYDYISKYRK